ncbi:ATP-binding cassette domain-containing protein [Halosegnis sp.]|uniref:ABC transporter ATP-binding protein n=1 Tax=Halosegnis sp. TaxID=2864959 RepID=UPI0035D5208C
MAAIDLSGVTKRYGDVTALHNLDMTVESGEVYGFLGPNGAGKSTTIDILLDFVRPTSGEVRVLGRDARQESVAVRARCGVLPEGFDTYDRLTARKHVEFAIESKGTDDDPIGLLERVGLSEAVDRKAGGFSKGMTQRLALAMALVGEPDLLVLDEPSTGLDPNGAREMRAIVREEADRGATVFFSSHVLGQVEAVCDRVGILREGELVAVDSVEGLREKSDTGTRLEIETSGVDEAALTAVRRTEGVSEARAEGTLVVVTYAGDAKMDVVNALEEHTTVADFTTHEASLEDVFAAYTEGER